MMREFYKKRLAEDRRLARRCNDIGTYLRSIKTPPKLFKHFAEIYSASRGNPAMFVRYDASIQTIVIEFASKTLIGADFPSNTPTANLMTRTLTERASVHIPTISGVERKSVLERINESAGRRIFSDMTFDVEFFDEGKVTTEQYYNRSILEVLPREFNNKDRGAVLLTPLGLERSTELGFGFIFEYQEKCPFSISAIREARTYSAFFMLLIAERIVAEMDKHL
jgi:hypothetical protein